MATTWMLTVWEGETVTTFATGGAVPVVAAGFERLSARERADVLAVLDARGLLPGREPLPVPLIIDEEE